MQVGFVVPGSLESTSGGYEYDRRVCATLQSRGHEVSVISLTEGSYPRQLAENASRLERRVSDCDIVIEDGLCQPSVLWPNRRIDVPIVGLLHMLQSQAVGGTGRPWQHLIRAVERRFLRQLDGAIYNSQVTKQSAQEVGGPRNGIVAPPGGDRFDPALSVTDIRARAQHGPIKVVYLGNVVERKGLGRLVEALSRTDLDWRLTVLGDTSMDPTYVRSVHRRIGVLDVVDRVRIHGRVSDEEVARRLREGHVIAMPSTYEPFGIAYLEGMSFGCVPVASSHGGASTFIADERSGFIVPPNPWAIAKRLENLADRDRLGEMGVRARRTYESQPTWNETCDQIERYLQSLAAEERSVPPMVRHP